MADKTLCEYSVPNVANVLIRPAVNMGDVNFELKTSLITWHQAMALGGPCPSWSYGWLQEGLLLLHFDYFVPASKFSKYMWNQVKSKH